MYEYINDEIVDFENTSVINFNGDNDFERPFEGIDGWFNSVPDSVDFWVETNKITNQPIVERLSTENGQEIEYLHVIDSEKNIGVESYTIINGGHDWFDFSLNGNSFNEIIWNSLSKYSQEENISNTKSDSDSILIDSE